MKRFERTALIMKTFNDEPNKVFSLNYFCEYLKVSKSTVSEDISMLRKTVEKANLGKLITTSGPSGGIRFVPQVTQEYCLNIQNKLCKALNNPWRFLGGGFIYTSDIMFDPIFSYEIASIFASKFVKCDADYVVTIETKGIPLALMTAKLLNIPAVVVRCEPKISEGPTISINYFSGAAGRMKKMSLSKKAMKPGSKAIIIDDFMRAGGSIKGICELLSELDVSVSGVGVAIASKFPVHKKISDYYPLVFLDDVNEESGIAKVLPNSNLSSIN